MAPIKRKQGPEPGVQNFEKKRKASPDATSGLSVLKDEEPAFPRGGASVLTPLEHKQIQIQAKQDVLFEQRTGKRAAKQDLENDESEESVKISTAPPKKKLGQKKKASALGKPPEERGPKIEGLSYKRLVPGSMVLGQVSQINQYDIALCLPNNLTGYVPLTSISDKVTKMAEALAEEDENSSQNEDQTAEINLSALFKLGQYLRAYVTSMHSENNAGNSKKRIEMSIHPRDTNSGLEKSEPVVNSMVQASVVSVEDHGLIMDMSLGTAEIRGFMSSKEVGQGASHTELEEGAVLLCIVTGLSSNGKIVKLSADPNKIGQIKRGNFLTGAPTVDSFLPGTAAELLVTEVTSSGIAGKIMGVIDATAELIHSGAMTSEKTLEKRYSVGSRVKGRIVCTFPTAQDSKVGISLLEHVLSFGSATASDSKTQLDPTEALPLSTVIERVQIVKIRPGVGLFVDLGIEGLLGFVHISRISDSKIESLSESMGPYKVGSVHKGRIIDYNSIDALFIVSLEPRIIELPFLRIEDVQIGQIVKGTIEKLIINATGVSGLLIKLTDNISGLVPETHLADVHLQHPEKRFKEGLSVKARVLSTNLEKRQIRLTLKKSLVNHDAAIWKSYDDLNEGMQSPGTIINIIPSGAVVQFYGLIRGFLPMSEMSESYIKDPKDHFRIGQVVNVHVLSVDPNEGRLLVSCKDQSTSGASQQRALTNIAIGSLLNAKVSEKLTDELVLELENTGLRAILPFEHLTDGSVAKSHSAAKRIRVGQDLQDLLVLHKQISRRLIKLTKKPSLIAASKSGTLPGTFDDVKQWSEVQGFVRNINSTGVFVEFANELTGLLLRHHMPEDALKLADFGMRRNQTLVARVISTDHDQHRFLLSTKKQAPPDGTAQATDRSLDLTNPADGVSTSMDDFRLGKITKARVVSVKETQMNVRLADGVMGRIDVSEIFDSWDDIKDRRHPMEGFRSKQTLPVRILGIHDSRNHRYLPISHRGRNPVFELSAKPTQQKGEELDVLTLDKVELGSTWLAFVNNIAENYVWVNISPNVRGRIAAIDLSDDISALTDLDENFPVGSALRARVTNIDVTNNRLDLSARSGSSSAAPATLKELSEGMILPSRVTKVTDQYIMVQLSETLSAPVYLIDMTDDYSTARTSAYRKNQIVRVCVIRLDVSNKKITLSTRPSKVLSSALKVVDREIQSFSQLKVNDIVRGFVKNVSDSGVFVMISTHITAFIRISDLSDAYIKDWKSQFQVDQLVKGKIIAVDQSIGHVQMSLKRSMIDKDYQAPLTYGDIQVGQVVTGKVRKVEEFGVFIVVDNSANVSGLCHRSELAEERVSDAKKLYEEGDVVKAKVLKLDLEKRRISFSLKASHFEAEDGDRPNEDEDSLEVETLIHEQAELDDNGDMASDEVIDDEDMNDVKDISSDTNSDIGSRAINGMTLNTNDATQSSNIQVSLGPVGFDWTGGAANHADEEEDEEEADFGSDADISRPQRKKRKRAEIKIDSTGDLDAHGPQSVADFERLLLSQPDASHLWVGYMAFYLEADEIRKAREVGERAIRTINVREDVEKLNVWVAYLNLENTFGTDSSLEEVFKRACQYNDNQETHERLTSIYIQSDKNEKADALFQSMVKKFSQDPKVWLNYATFLFDTAASPAQARTLLSRALQSLPKHHHLDLTSKFAQLEFRSPNGDAERGRTVFEGLLSTFPKRLDLWNILVDLEIRQGDKQQVRRLFERVTSSNLKVRKAKYFFKKWLEYEQKEGDPRTCENVEARAAEYVRQQEGKKQQG